MSDISYTNKIIKEKQGSVVTLLQAKKQLNVDADFTDDDDHITLLIDSATRTAEDYTGTDIELTVNTLESINFKGNSIVIKESPFISLTSIISTKDGVDTVILPDEYSIQINIIEFQILFDKLINADKLVIVFETGYTSTTIPSDLVSAILIKTNSLYDIERESYTVGANFRDNKAFERLLYGHTINRW